ncbi:MAG TPA: hypothetical protein VFF67_07335 [Thermoplasmata archaeon]|nr:hypothetical protein [Thermoplasmata archaeon]
MPNAESPVLERSLLLHLLAHRGHQVRFEADQHTTEFGILRAFSAEDPLNLRTALRSLENTRLVYRRVQYVIGYSEPKLVYSLTPSGHRKALASAREARSGGTAAYPELGNGGGNDEADTVFGASPSDAENGT